MLTAMNVLALADEHLKLDGATTGIRNPLLKYSLYTARNVHSRLRSWCHCARELRSAISVNR